MYELFVDDPGLAHGVARFSSSGDSQGYSYRVLTIGRAGTCNVLLDSDDVAPVHAYLVGRSNHRYVLAVGPISFMGKVYVDTTLRCDYEPMQIGRYTIQFWSGFRTEEKLPLPASFIGRATLGNEPSVWCRMWPSEQH